MENFAGHEEPSKTDSRGSSLQAPVPGENVGDAVTGPRVGQFDAHECPRDILICIKLLTAKTHRKSLERRCMRMHLLKSCT